MKKKRKKRKKRTETTPEKQSERNKKERKTNRHISHKPKKKKSLVGVGDQCYLSIEARGKKMGWPQNPNTGEKKIKTKKSAVQKKEKTKI